MLTLGIETSCDDTAAAVLCDGKPLSSIVSSQHELHHKYGGVVPELASRAHIQNIAHVLEAAMEQAQSKYQDIDRIAVTQGPGLIGSLLVGLSVAKGLASSLRCPLIGVNHLAGHVSSVWLNGNTVEYPALSLVASGGHTVLFHQEEERSVRLVGKTRDDSVGEILDKIAVFLRLGYPGGPVIERWARHGDEEAISFPIATMSDGSLDFSFSGLKSAALRYLKAQRIAPLDPDEDAPPGEAMTNFLASFQAAALKNLLSRVEQAYPHFPCRTICLSGGVGANQRLRELLADYAASEGVQLVVPPTEFCTDNAAMIACAACRFEWPSSQAAEIDACSNLAFPSAGEIAL